MYTLLFIDRDMDALRTNSSYFSEAGYAAFTVTTVEETIETLQRINPDCIILDTCFCHEEGYDICKRFKQNRNIPVICISEQTGESDMICSFEAGCADYINKPYSLKELELRIARRVQDHITLSNEASVLRIGDLLINISARKAYLKGRIIDFTNVEFELFLHLAQKRGRVFSQSEIYSAVWKQLDMGDLHTVQVHIGRMRKKLKNIDPDTEYIQTVWGKGYMFLSPENEMTQANCSA